MNSNGTTYQSSGISAGVTINYNNGFQTEGNGVSISASQSKMNSNGTTYQNGRFVNVDEVHNNTKNMTLSGFNQEGGKVTGNIENLTIESKQNTSTTKGSTKGGSLSVSANGLPSGSVNYSQTNGERRVVDNASTFIIGDGSDLKVGKVENTAAAIGTSGNGKLSIDEYVGHNLENVDKLKTVGASVGVSTSGITSIGVNYSDKKQEGITKNTVIGNVEIGKSSGDEINRDLDTMTEITEDRDFKTNINVESQTINYIKNPEKFKEDLQIALIEGKATGRTVVKTIDNMINGNKSQDIGDAERRSLIEIKEAIVRVQTAPAMDIIAEKDLTDKNIQARLGVEIEKFDPNAPTLSEKVKERIDELKAEGKEIVAFYDKVTKKIFINQNAKDKEVRPSLAREWKIREDLIDNKGKANDKGQLRSTVAGEIAYEEIQKRIAKNKANPIDIAKLDNAQMNPDSEVTADGYRAELEAKNDIAKAEAEYRKKLKEIADRYEFVSSLTPKEMDKIAKEKEQARIEKDRKIAKINEKIGVVREYEKYAREEVPLQFELMNSSAYTLEKAAYKSRYLYLRRNIDTTKEYREDITVAYKDGFKEGITEGAVTGAGYKLAEKIITGTASVSSMAIGGFFFWSEDAGAPDPTTLGLVEPKKDPRKRISAETDLYMSSRFPEYYKQKGAEYTVISDLNYKNGINIPRNQAEKMDKAILRDIKNYYDSTPTLDKKLYKEDMKFFANIVGFELGYKGASKFIPNRVTSTEGNLVKNGLEPNNITNNELNEANGKLSTTVKSQNVKLHEGKQGKHVVGHNNFQQGKGEVDMQTASNILNDFQGTGQKIERDGKIVKEIVDTQGKYNGIFIDKDTGQRSITSRFTIHYDSKGTAHIVPANPNPK